MFQKKIIALSGLCLVFLFGCGNASNRRESKAVSADSATSSYAVPAAGPEQYETATETSFSANATNKGESPSAVTATTGATSGFVSVAGSAANSTPEKKIIHSADFSCRVGNVFNTVKKLETITKSLGGFIESSEMSSPLEEAQSVYRGDSVAHYASYNTAATLTLRVPLQGFDSLISAIPEMAKFVDSRKVHENDATFQYYANKLRAEASAQRSAELKVVPPGKKPDVDFERYKDEKLESTIDRKMANLGIDKSVYFATIVVSLSQDKQMYYAKEVDPGAIASGHFGAGCAQAAAAGFDGLKMLIMGLISIWPVLMIGAIVAWAVVRHTRKRSAKLQTAMQPS